MNEALLVTPLLFLSHFYRPFLIAVRPSVRPALHLASHLDVLLSRAFLDNGETHMKSVAARAAFRK